MVALLVLATNPFALLFCLPALHAWLWLPQVRSRGPAVRALVFAVGLIGPLLLLGSLAVRFGLGFDAPWYVLELVALALRVVHSQSRSPSSARLAGRSSRWSQPDATRRIREPGSAPRAGPSASSSAASRRRTARVVSRRDSGPASLPASSPSPRSTSTSASACAARAIMCDSSPCTASSATASASTRRRTRTSWSRSRSRRTPAASLPGSHRGSGSAAPCSASSAGRTKSSKPTSTRPDCPEGRRRACSRARRRRPACPARPRRARTPRRPPAAASAPRTRSCWPTETPPDVISTSPSSPSSSARRVASSSSAHRIERARVGARLGRLRREQQRVRLVDLTGRERLAGRAELAPRREEVDPGPPPTDGVIAPTGAASAPMICGGEPRSGARDDRTGGDVTAPRPHVVAAGNDFLDIAGPSWRVRSTGHDRVRAGRYDGARRDRGGLAGGHPAGRGAAGSRRRDDEQAPGGIGGRTAYPSIAELSNGGRSTVASAVCGEHPAGRARSEPARPRAAGDAREHERRAASMPIRELTAITIIPRRWRGRRSPAATGCSSRSAARCDERRLARARTTSWSGRSP